MAFDFMTIFINLILCEGHYVSHDIASVLLDNVKVIIAISTSMHDVT